jgi:hypothetical protein
MEVPGERIDVPSGSDDRPPRAYRVEQSDPDYMLVRSTTDVHRLSADILGERERPIVCLTRGEDGSEPVLSARDVRVLVGPGARIYLIADEHLLDELNDRIGPRLMLERASARIWWPGASVRCDPLDHPLVVALEGERPQDTLLELSHQLDLSRPYVRAQIALLEDARAFLEHELNRMRQRNREIHQRLRDAQIDCHRERTRADAAEARLAALERQQRSG